MQKCTSPKCLLKEHLQHKSICVTITKIENIYCTLESSFMFSSHYFYPKLTLFFYYHGLAFV